MEEIPSCAICFDVLIDKETGRPDVCDHVFCLQCLQKWGKHGSFCPVDRKRFKKIINLSTSTEIPIKPRKRKKQQPLYDISSHCEVCTNTKVGDFLILCDCCDLAYHLPCLTPPLSEVPPGIWNCPCCVAIGEKLKSKKGLTKDVESIVRNHTNLNPASSSTESSSETDRVANQSTKKKTNSSNRLKTYLKSKNGMPSSAISSSSRKKIYRKKQDSDTLRKISLLKNCTAKLRSLRPREETKHKYLDETSDSSEYNSLSSREKVKDKYLDDTSDSVEFRSLRPRKREYRPYRDYSSDSSDEFQSKANNQFIPSTSAGPKNNHRKTRSLRPRELQKKKFHYDYFIDSDPSDRLNDDLPQNSSDVSSPASIECYDPLPLDDKEFENEVSFVDAEVPNAGEMSDSGNPNICIMTSAYSIKGSEEKVHEPEDQIGRSTSVDYSENNYPNLISMLNNPVQDSPDDDEICIVDTVVKNPNFSNPMTFENVTEAPEPPSDFLKKHSSSDDLPDLSLEDINSNFKKQTQLKTDNSELFMSSKFKGFSVFEKLEDEDLSRKKYSELNLAITKLHPSKNYKDSAILVKKNLSREFDVCSKNAKKLRSFNSHKTRELSKELRAIEKVKWKPHLRSKESRRPSHKLSCCQGCNNSDYKLSDTAHVGKYFCKKKYSDSYNELLSITKPLWKKPKWEKSDVVILNNLKTSNRKDQKNNGSSSFIHNLCSSAQPHLSAGKIDESSHEDIISIDTENLLSLIETESELLRAAICLSDIKHLSVKKDSLLNLNYKKT